MARIGFYTVTRAMFACLLTAGFASVLLIIRSTYHSKMFPSLKNERHIPKLSEVSLSSRGDHLGLRGLAGDAADHPNNASLYRPHKGNTHHDASSAVHPPGPALARFPPANSSALQVSVDVIGMLGNHMFQYASLLGIAHMNGRRPFGPLRMALHEFFHVSHIQSSSTSGFREVYEKDFASYDPSFERLPNYNVILLQYLQSWKYFDAIRDTIRQEFKFKKYLKVQAAKLLNKHVVQIGQKVKVGIHVRRGDMASHYSKMRGYYTAPTSYLFQAMDYMRKKHGDVVFIVVSDSLSWCANALKTASDCIIVDNAPGEVHLALLASCDHVVMTVGTYGWWGGYLSGGDVVYYWDPKVCVHHPSLPVEIRHPEDFFPPNWTSLPGR